MAFVVRQVSMVAIERRPGISPARVSVWCERLAAFAVDPELFSRVIHMLNFTPCSRSRPVRPEVSARPPDSLFQNCHIAGPRRSR